MKLIINRQAYKFEKNYNILHNYHYKIATK
jgi:hypothetical protein